ncbi:MAG: hypothetical protein ACJ72E_00165 [Marmoricola sp.]
MDPEPPDAPSVPPTRAPVPLRVAGVLVALEGTAIAVLGALEALNTSSLRVVMGATTSLFFVVFGLALVACAWGLSRVAAWARGPVLIAQLISLGMAWSFKAPDTWGISVLLAVPAVAVLIAMLHPATLAALDDEG